MNSPPGVSTRRRCCNWLIYNILTKTRYKTGENEYFPLWQRASSKTARSTGVDIMAKYQINMYAAGLHRRGSKGVEREDETPVHKAVREAFTNMIIHSDLMITGVFKVVKQDHCLTFSNPGTLKLPLERIYHGGATKARNPRLQNLFRMIGLGDNLGSGFPTILSAWKDEKWKRPDLQEDFDLRQVDLKLWMVSLFPPEAIEYMRHLLGDKFDGLSSDEQAVLAIAPGSRLCWNSNRKGPQLAYLYYALSQHHILKDPKPKTILDALVNTYSSYSFAKETSVRHACSAIKNRPEILPPIFSKPPSEKPRPIKHRPTVTNT